MVIADVQKVPVIESGTLKLGVVKFKSHRADKMQPCAGGGAGAGDVAAVLGYLRLDKNDIQLCQKIISEDSTCII